MGLWILRINFQPRGLKKRLKRLMLSKDAYLFWDNIKRYKRFYIQGIVSLLVVDILDLFPPLIIKVAIDYISDLARGKNILPLAILFVFVACLQGLFRYGWRINLVGAAFRIEYDMKANLFRHLEKLSRSYFQSITTGDIMARATNDLETVRMAVGMGILITLDALFYILFIPIIMIYLSPGLTLLSFLFLPFLPFFVKHNRTIIDRKSDEALRAFSRISEKVRENVSGIRVIKAFNGAEQEIASFSQINEECRDKNLSLAFIQAYFLPFMEYFIDAGMVLLITVGGIYAINGAITIGTFVAFQRYISRLIWPMKAVGWAIYLLQKGLASMRRIRDVLETQPERAEDGNQRDMKIIRGRIEFKKLSFTYPGASKPALKGINLEISPGMLVAFVGPIGSGKSTLASLIPGLYPINRGGLFLDGVDINDISLERVRENIGFVPQETFLFSESIYENIAFGLGKDTRPSYSVEEASRIAMIHDEIQSFPYQYDSYLGERGINLSGGQKQRLTLARALIKKPAILILDDAFSSVDVEKEEAIYECLRKEREGLTTIIVTHRLAKIKDADMIVVFNEGEIVERGRHDGLLTQDGLYAKLFKSSQLKEEINK